MNDHIRPNRFLRWLFEKLLPFDPLGVSSADIEEVYASIADESSKRRADLWYIGQIFSSIPAALNNSQYWGLFMFKHYAIAAIRNFKRHRLTTALNITGLSAAVGATIVMFLFIDLQLNMDSFHENLDDIYLVEHEARVGDAVDAWGNSPMPLGPEMAESIPGVAATVRLARGSASMQYGDMIAGESLRFADDEFFNVFTFPLVSGNATEFENGRGIILSERTTAKYFGEDDPVGQEVFLTLSNGKTIGTVVSGVAERVPMASSFGFHVLAPYSYLTELDVDLSDWGAYTSATYALLRPGAEASEVEEGMSSFLPLVAAANQDREVTKLMLESLTDLPTSALQLKQSPSAGVFPVAYLMFGFIALLVLLVACLSYVNIAIAKAMQRSKEIGLRKVVGSYRIQLIGQFLGENIILSLGALVIGVFLAEFLFIPWINSTQDGLGFELNYLENRLLWMFLLGVLGVTGVGAGLYPALFVSRFQPSKVLRGTLQVTGKKRLTRLMLGAQLVFSFLLLTFGVVLLENAKHQRNLDWGYDSDNRIVVPFQEADQMRSFRSELDMDANVIRTAGSTEHIGRGAQPLLVKYEGQELSVDQMGVGFNYLETMGVRLREGRFFDENRAADAQGALVVNSKFALSLGLPEVESAVGQFVEVDGRQMEIIGVAEDLYSSAFVFGIEPTVFTITPEESHRFLVIQVSGLEANQFGEVVLSKWRKSVPNTPFTGFYQHTILDDYFAGLDGSAKIFLFISGIALIIAVMGLFGLVLITVTKRGREIGIRKSLGASDWNIIRVMQSDTLKVAVISLLIGAPISYLAISVVMNGLNQATSDSGEAFVMRLVFLLSPIVIILAATILTSVAGSYRGARMKPVDILRQNAN